jgi:hypothetical protein
MAGANCIHIVHRDNLMGFLACQPAEPNTAFADDQCSTADPHCVVRNQGMDLMRRVRLSMRDKMRIASRLTGLIGVLLMAFFVISCAAAGPPIEGTEMPGAPAPAGTEVKTLEFVIPTARITPGVINVSPSGTPEGLATAIPEQAFLHEQRLMSIEWPSSIRVGDSDIIRLTLEADKQGQITPSVEVSGHQLLGKEISIPNLYDIDNIIAEARLDMAGLNISPDGAVRQTMLPGQTLIFYWSISPNQAGSYRGTLWVYLDLIPKSGGEMDQRTLIAHRIDIQSNTVFGLPATTARWFGAGGAMLSSILGFPFLEKILERLWKILHREKMR